MNMFSCYLELSSWNEAWPGYNNNTQGRKYNLTLIEIKWLHYSNTGYFDNFRLKLNYPFTTYPVQINFQHLNVNLSLYNR